MLNNEIIKNITEYFKNLTEFEIDDKQIYQIYNNWVLQSGIIINDSKTVNWIIDYIKDLTNMDLSLLHT